MWLANACIKEILDSITPRGSTPSRHNAITSRGSCHFAMRSRLHVKGLHNPDVRTARFNEEAEILALLNTATAENRLRVKNLICGGGSSSNINNNSSSSSNNKNSNNNNNKNNNNNNSSSSSSSITISGDLGTAWSHKEYDKRMDHWLWVAILPLNLGLNLWRYCNKSHQLMDWQSLLWWLYNYIIIK